MSAVVLTVAGPQHAGRHAPGGADNLGAFYVTSAAAQSSRDLFPAPRLRGDTIDSFIARPDGSSATRSPLEWIHDDSAGYLMHLTGGPNMSGSSAFIGMGVDNGGTGLFVNNKKTGIGIKLTQNDTITSALAYGMLINASSSVAPAFYYAQGIANAKPGVTTQNVQGAAGSRLWEWRVSSSTGNSDVLAGYITADTGNLVWQTQASFQAADVNTIPLLVVGLASQAANLQEWRVAGGGGTVAKLDKSGNTTATSFLAQATGAYLGLSDSGGPVDSRRFHIQQSGGSLLITARQDNLTNKGTIFQVDQSGNQTVRDAANFILGSTTGTKFATAATQKLGFYGATPVVRPTGVAVDLAAVHAALVSLGLIAA